MQFTELPSKGLERFFKVIIDAKKISSQVNIELQRLIKTIAMPGFRVGKAPMSVVQKKYGDAVRSDILSKEIQSSIETIVKDYKLDIATRPSIEDIKNEAPHDVEFTVKFEVMPHVTLPNLQEIKLTRPKLKVTKNDVNQKLQAMLDRHVEFTSSPSTKAKKGHQVVIDFVGSIDGEKFKGGAAENHKLILGSKSFIEGFEDQLIGKKSGDEVIVSVTFPQDYHAPNLAGKNAEFKVTIHDVCTPKTLELDDDFAKKMHRKDLDDLRESVEKSITESYDTQIYTILKMQLFDNLEKMLKFEIPSSLAEREYRALKQQSERLEDHETSHTEADLDKYYRRVSTRRVKIGLMLSEYVKTHSITLEQQDLERAVMQETLGFPGQEIAIIDYYKNNKAALESLSGRALEDKAVRMIMANDIVITDKLYSSEEIEKLIQEENDKDVI
jgi:trigger factor